MEPRLLPGVDRSRLERISAKLVGRTTELELILAAISSGRDLILEGPPGTSKTTLLKAIASEWDVPLVFVEGNSDLTAAKLIGHHVPSRVLQEGYNPDNFVAGPLVEAMQAGGFLYIEELNRTPQETLNALLSAIGERQIAIPRMGTIAAEPTFRMIGSMNPFDNVGTTRISMSIHDRLCRLAIGYQDESAEREIVRLRTSPGASDVGGGSDARLIHDAVALARRTRDHPDIRHGSSVRGAIDLTLVARELSSSRGVPLDHRGEAYRALVLDAMSITLSGRIQLDAATERTPEAVLRDIWERYFSDPDSLVALDDEGMAGNNVRAPREVIERPFRRRPKTLTSAPRLFLPSPSGPGVLLPADGPAGADPAVPHLPSQPGASSDVAALAALPDCDRDPLVVQRAMEIADRLALSRRRPNHHRATGSGLPATVPYTGSSDDIDLDGTLEKLTERAGAPDPEIMVRDRVGQRRAVVLAVDVSGSMRGERVRTAAAAVGAIAGELHLDQLAVVAFWSDAALLLELGQPVQPAPLLDTLLRLPSRGLTNVGFPLLIAARQLSSCALADRRVLLLSDCVHNAGPDPRAAAGSLPRLDILVDVSGENDLEMARQLARAGQGTFQAIRNHRDVAPALDAAFTA